MHQDRLEVLEVLGDQREVVLDRKGGSVGAALVNRGQLENLGTRKDARRIADERPNHVGGAVADLPVELRRLSAERHGRIDLHLDSPLRLLLDALCPGGDEGGVRGRLRAEEMMHRQSDLGGACRSGEHNRGDHSREQTRYFFHVTLLALRAPPRRLVRGA